MSGYGNEQGLLHGGNLLSASTTSGIPLADWLDLSTGISPYAYPFTTLSSRAFTDLPYLTDAFFDKVRAYYGEHAFLPVPGSQAVIQVLPASLPRLPILLPSLGYQEHQQAWQKSGTELNYYNALDSVQAYTEIAHQLQKNPAQHLLVINPNNPTTLRFDTRQLLAWANALEQGACLIVDEAFIDSHVSMDAFNGAAHSRAMQNDASMLPHLSENILVLRSFGKFFGLAGLRLGFVFAAEAILARIQPHFPLWSITGPAAAIAEQALGDREWHAEHILRLLKAAQLRRDYFQPLADTARCSAVFHDHLFSAYLLEEEAANAVFQRFFEAGILLRKIPVNPQQSLIRIGCFQDADTQRITDLICRI